MRFFDPVRDQKVEGSTPSAPTIFLEQKTSKTPMFSGFFAFMAGEPLFPCDSLEQVEIRGSKTKTNAKTKRRQKPNQNQ